MEDKLFLRSDDIMAILDIGRTSACAIINKLNKELEKKGYLVQPHRLSKKYFKERFGIESL